MDWILNHDFEYLCPSGPLETHITVLNATLVKLRYKLTSQSLLEFNVWSAKRKKKKSCLHLGFSFLILKHVKRFLDPQLGDLRFRLAPPGQWVWTNAIILSTFSSLSSSVQPGNRTSDNL